MITESGTEYHYLMPDFHFFGFFGWLLFVWLIIICLVDYYMCGTPKGSA